MADDGNMLSKELLQEQRDALGQRAWYLSDHYLGGGGGGVAYLCAQAQALNQVQHHLQMINPQLDPSSGIIGRSMQPPPEPRMVYEHLLGLRESFAKLLAPHSPPLGVFKYALRQDWRFRQEIKVLQRCSHANLMRIFEADSAEEPRWYVMEFVPGGSLTERAKDYRDKPREVLKQLNALTSAVATLHAAGFVHRDIKPDNIYVRPDGSWVLADPGIAFDNDATQKTEHFLSMTKEWRPPWTMNRKFNPWPVETDIHMLGKVAYWALTGGEFNPNPSQLSDPDFLLQNVVPGLEHGVQIHDFITGNVTEKQNQMKSHTIKEFQAETVRLLELFDHREHQVQLLSIFSLGPEANVGEDIHKLQNLRVLLPTNTTAVKGCVRFYSGGEFIRSQFGASLKKLDGYGLAAIVHDLEIRKPTGGPEIGHWLDFGEVLTVPSSGPCFFSVEKTPLPAMVTALQLWAKYRA